MYLGLGVDATQIQTQYPMHPTQEQDTNLQSHILTGLSPSTVHAIPSKLQLNKRRLKIKSKTPHLHIPHSTGFSLSCIVFARRY